ncbi:MAG TPA: murein biosynthesis integral membrane protein MurJ [Tepidisphaeraceae bacterium]|nr:murein biosynthesis integral membrane protein MurJ [Tepidisphaeraceae bacterium]
MSQETTILPYASPPSDPKSAPSFLGHAKLIGGLTLASRVLGLGREIIAGHYMGTRLVASAFTVAFTIPNLFRKLFGEGALSAAFIPLYTQSVKREREEAEPPARSAHGASEDSESAHALIPRPALFRDDPRVLSTHHSALSTFPSSLPQSNAFAAAAVTLLCAILVGITIVGEAILLTIIFRSHNMLVERMLTLKLTAIMLPYVVLICGGAFLSGILQVHKRFGPPAAAPMILNVCHILVLLIGARLLHLRASTPVNVAVVLQTKLAYWLAGFVLVAGVLQVWVLVPALKRMGFAFVPVLKFWTPAIRRMLWLSVPVALGAGVMQISVLLDKALSLLLMQGVDKAGQTITHFHFMGHLIRYPMQMGAPRRLDLAQFMYQFPLGIFAIALATAIFPNLSSDALDKDRKRFRDVLRQGIEAALWEGLPASVGLVLIRGPAISLLFRHGQITTGDVNLIGSSLLFYACAIWAFSVLQIINRAYYALHDTVTPLVMSIVNIVLNLVVEIPLVWTRLGESGMAVGTMVSFAIQALVMLWLLDRKIGGLGLRQSAKPVAKMLLATAVMGGACWFVVRLPGYPHAQNRISWAAQVMLLATVGASVYACMCALLGVGMLQQLRPRRMSRMPAAPGNSQRRE